MASADSTLTTKHIQLSHLVTSTGISHTPVVQSSNIVEDLRRNVSLNFVLQYPSGSSIGSKCSLEVRLFQYLCQFNPCLDIIRELLCHLPQVALGNVSLRLAARISIQ